MRENHLGPQGGAALAKGLEGNATLTSLECAAVPCTCHIRKVLGLADQRQPLTLVAPRRSLALFGSLNGTALCGINEDGSGIYTSKSISALCEGIKGSAIISLRCVHLPKMAG